MSLLLQVSSDLLGSQSLTSFTEQLIERLQNYLAVEDVAFYLKFNQLTFLLIPGSAYQECTPPEIVELAWLIQSRDAWLDKFEGLTVLSQNSIFLPLINPFGHSIKGVLELKLAMGSRLEPNIELAIRELSSPVSLALDREQYSITMQTGSKKDEVLSIDPLTGLYTLEYSHKLSKHLFVQLEDKEPKQFFGIMFRFVCNQQTMKTIGQIFRNSTRSTDLIVAYSPDKVLVYVDCKKQDRLDSYINRVIILFKQIPTIKVSSGFLLRTEQTRDSFLKELELKIDSEV